MPCRSPSVVCRFYLEYSLEAGENSCLLFHDQRLQRAKIRLRGDLRQVFPGRRTESLLIELATDHQPDDLLQSVPEPRGVDKPITGDWSVNPSKCACDSAITGSPAMMSGKFDGEFSGPGIAR